MPEQLRVAFTEQFKKILAVWMRERHSCSKMEANQKCWRYSFNSVAWFLPAEDWAFVPSNCHDFVEHVLSSRREEKA